MNILQKHLFFWVLFFSFSPFSNAQNNCNSKIENRVNITLCQNDIYQFGDKTITSSGIYIQIFVALSNGCDSVVTLGVDYLNNSNFNLFETIIIGNSFFFNGQELTESGIYRDTFIDSRGCDSVLTLTLETILEHENCENGKDDDGDGLVDAFDSDCLCLLDAEAKNIIPNGNFEEKVGCCRGITNEGDFCLDNWINLSGRSIIYHHPECWAVLGQELTKEGVTLESGFMAGSIATWVSLDFEVVDLNGFSLGICLSEPMYAGNTYILSFDLGRSFDSQNLIEEMHFTVNGIADCNEIDKYLFDTEFCDKNLSFEILAQINLVTLGPGWNSFTFTLQPQTTVEAIFFSGNCDDKFPRDNVRNNSYHVFYDNFSIVSENGLRLKNEIKTVEAACESNQKLFVPNASDLSIDWYKDSIYFASTKGIPLEINNTPQSNFSYSYHAKVTFEDGRCQLLGPIYVENLEFNLPKDTFICKGDNLFLNVAQTGLTYLWHNGSTQPTFTTEESGTYWVEVSKEDCVVRDSIIVNYFSQPTFLPNDTILCNEESHLIVPKGQFDTIFWGESSTLTNSLLVNETGLYQGLIIGNSCEWMDSIYVDFAQLKINLPLDTILCQPSSLLLDVGQVEGIIHWQDGSSNTQFLVQQSGQYWVELKDEGCLASDTINIQYENLQFDLGEDTALCEGETLELSTNISDANYEWQDGSNESSLNLTTAGLYWLEIIKNGCVERDSISVEAQNCEEGLCKVFIPNVFSPNNDGINDAFQLFSNCDLASYSLEIYDRWGNLVFSTNSEQIIWDGTQNGQQLENGVYLVKSEYQLADQNSPIVEVKTLTLVR